MKNILTALLSRLPSAAFVSGITMGSELSWKSIFKLKKNLSPPPVRRWRGRRWRLELGGACKRQPTFTLEKSFQSPIARATFAPDDPRSNALSKLTAIASAFEPIFVTDSALNRNAGDF